MNEITILEKRLHIFIGIIALLIVTPLVVGFTYMLIKESSAFAHEIIFILLASAFVIGSKDALIMLLVLCSKLISPYKIIFDRNGFYDCKLRQHISWDKIDRIEYLDYKKTFIKKSAILEYILYMSLVRNTTAIIFDFIKYCLLSKVGATKRIVIITQNKEELLEKATLLKKLESKMLPKNMININLEPSCANQEDIPLTIKAVGVFNKTL